MLCICIAEQPSDVLLCSVPVPLNDPVEFIIPVSWGCLGPSHETDHVVSRIEKLSEAV